MCHVGVLPGSARINYQSKCQFDTTSKSTTIGAKEGATITTFDYLYVVLLAVITAKLARKKGTRFLRPRDYLLRELKCHEGSLSYKGS